MKVGVIGAGQMGSGIAQVCAQAGLDVVLYDHSADALRRARERIAYGVERTAAKGQSGGAAPEAVLARLAASTDEGALAQADFVIEAATEDLAVKLAILRSVSKAVRADAVIATNTSSLSVTRLAAAVEGPERFVGMHFFNPVPLLALVEVIPGRRTSANATAAAVALAQGLGKQALVTRNQPGFIVNRILLPMVNEAVCVLQEGLASAEQVDLAMTLGARHPMGPLALADLIGIDTCLAAMETLYQSYGDPKYRPATLLRELVEAGDLGRKAGRGFYRY